MLKEDFVPVAIDQWYQRRQQDAEGEFYRKVAKQGPRKDMQQTTQGRYICTSSGNLLGYNNNRGPERLKAIMKRTLVRVRPAEPDTQPLTSTTPDPIAMQKPSPETIVVGVSSKILSGYKPTKNWKSAFHDSVGRDNLWILKEEVPELIKLSQTGGNIPERIAKRIVRFHLVDNTRGEPPRWSNKQIRDLKIKVDDKGALRGKVHLETESGDRGYAAELFGIIKSENEKLTRFDIVAKGDFWGVGKYTPNAPKGKFPLVVAFRIVDRKDPADLLMPHGAKGWPPGYFKSEQ